MDVCRSPLSWVEQGAWGDCEPLQVFATDVPTQANLVTAALQLPGSLISGWLANQGSQNYGLLLR